MTALVAILLSGIAMSAVALVGSLTLLMPEAALRRALLPLLLAVRLAFGGGG